VYGAGYGDAGYPDEGYAGDGPGAVTSGGVAWGDGGVDIGGKAGASLLLMCGDGGPCMVAAVVAAAVAPGASRTPRSAARRETRRNERIRITSERRKDLHARRRRGRTQRAGRACR